MVELAELSQDLDFRAGMRRIVDSHVASSAPGLQRDPVAIVRDQVGPALAAGVDPVSSRADAVVAAAVAQYAQISGGLDDVDLRRRLLTRLEIANDPRRERYLQLLAVVNGWQAPESLTPALNWFIQALRARTPSPERGR